MSDLETGYKVVGIRGDEYISVWIGGTNCPEVEPTVYHMGTKTSRKSLDNHGPLSLFSDKQIAISWASFAARFQHMDIAVMECEFTPSEDTMLWQKGCRCHNSKKKGTTMPLFRSTCVADAIILNKVLRVIKQSDNVPPDFSWRNSAGH